MIFKIHFYVVLLFITLLSTNSFASGFNIKKVEPMFWWTGMKNPNLQLLIYGENIGTAEVSINYDGVSLKKVNKVDNQNYLFIDILISDKTKPGKFQILFSKENKEKLIYDYELKVRTHNPDNHKGFNSSDVIYLLMPDRFSNADTLNDNVETMLEKSDRNNPDGRHGGDIQGIINHLAHISDLGATALWINPLFENNNPLYSYHGYAITDFYKTDLRFGTNKDYLKLVNECHKKGLKIIMDLVLNHCSTEHWFIKDLPVKDWIHQFPEFTRCNYRTSTITDPYASEIDKKLMLTGWFDRNMADLNQKNIFLATYLIQNTIWWIEYSGIDGIRLDTQPYSDKNMVADWSKSIFEEYPDFNIVGEAWLQKEAITAYWQKDTKNKDNYNSNIPSITDFPMYFAIASAFNEEESWTEGIARLYYILTQDFLYAKPENNLIFVDNHDINRFYENIKHDFNKYKMGLAFLLTTRGIPMIYYGTEILMSGEEHKGHGEIRKDFPGGWENDNINAFNKEERTPEQNEAFDYLQKLLKWRKNKNVIHTGKLTHYIPVDGIYVYFRHNEKESVMVVLNNKNTVKTLNLDYYKENLMNYSSGTDIITKTNIILNEPFEIPGKSAMIIELE
ncbi:MAG: glycoside hydrolase family 13 protein [Bacteroidales bacterium]|nr:glycoside hydrolase family 13 protein [Bacteroidales bacterium]